MADGINEKIDINHAGTGELTQLPGIAIDLARAIINHRQRHGMFTSFEELAHVKNFPVERLDEIRERVFLNCEDVPCNPPRHLDSVIRRKDAKRTDASTRRLRSTRGKDRGFDPSSHRPKKAA